MASRLWRESSRSDFNSLSVCSTCRTDFWKCESLVAMVASVVFKLRSWRSTTRGAMATTETAHAFEAATLRAGFRLSCLASADSSYSHPRLLAEVSVFKTTFRVRSSGICEITVTSPVRLLQQTRRSLSTVMIWSQQAAYLRYHGQKFVAADHTCCSAGSTL